MGEPDHEILILPPQTLSTFFSVEDQDLQLYFPDGNIILIAGPCMFRVYRGILAKHSDIFEAMFSLPTCSNGGDQDAIEGCPLVRMYDDPYELAQLLCVLHDYKYVIMQSP